MTQNEAEQEPDACRLPRQVLGSRSSCETTFVSISNLARVLVPCVSRRSIAFKICVPRFAKMCGRSWQAKVCSHRFACPERTLDSCCEQFPKRHPHGFWTSDWNHSPFLDERFQTWLQRQACHSHSKLFGRRILLWDVLHWSAARRLHCLEVKRPKRGS